MDVVRTYGSDSGAVLESWQRSLAIRAQLAKRDRIILDMASGTTISKISRNVGIRRRFVYKWVDRFNEQGIEGLSDKNRPGRPKRTD